MSFSVGILYSAQEFAAYIFENTITVENFKKEFHRFSLAAPQDILDVSFKCNWFDFDTNGICRITQGGKRLLGISSEMCLRQQICDLILAEEPAWAVKIPNGRNETIKFLPVDVAQCFKEAGLLRGWDDEVVSWWDMLATATRSNKSKLGLEVGRSAERLTIAHEKKRTGFDPHWQSIESNFSGYDVLSKVDDISSIPRMIEVKGSSLPRKEAVCFVTRNEWRTAKLAADYRFHLWSLRGEPYLIDVSVEEMEKHIPEDCGDGFWETTKIWFKSFKVM